MPGLAEALGVGRLLVKDESSRLGLPAFKMLGASWASYRARQSTGSATSPSGSTLDDLAARARTACVRSTLATATDGNHGRAVARFARLLGLERRIFVPDGHRAPHRRRHRVEGASVSRSSTAATTTPSRGRRDDAADRCLVISDTSWPGYDRAAAPVIEGYSTIFAEIEDALCARRPAAPEVVLVPIGVGALAAASVAYTAARPRPIHPGSSGSSPTPPLRDRLGPRRRAGRGARPHRSIMVGLNCGNASPIAWPVISIGLDWLTAIPDTRAEDAMRLLAAEGIEAGETGSAALAGALAVAASAERDAIGFTASATVLLLCTEGVTDPVNYEKIVGHPPSG